MAFGPIPSYSSTSVVHVCRDQAYRYGGEVGDINGMFLNDLEISDISNVNFFNIRVNFIKKVNYSVFKLFLMRRKRKMSRKNDAEHLYGGSKWRRDPIFVYFNSWLLIG